MPNINPITKLTDVFPEVLPHRKEEANEWLHGYLRLVIRIQKEREELKKATGSVGVDTVLRPPNHILTKRDA